MSSGISEEITRILEEKKNNAEKNALESLKKAEKAIPELKWINDTVRNAGVLKGYMMLRRDVPQSVRDGIASVSPELLKRKNEAELDADIAKLGARKQRLLARNGLSESSFLPAYECKICGDTGFVKDANGLRSRCQCYRSLLSEALTSRAGLPVKCASFDAFDDSLYPEEPDKEKYGVSSSPREHMKNVFRDCVDYAENFGPESENMLFIGAAGLGKTFLASCIAEKLLSECVPVVYVTVSSLFRAFSPFSSGDGDEADMYRELRKAVTEAELLIIDDLGTEKRTGTKYESLLEILNLRSSRDMTGTCKTIITTNLLPSEMEEYYGERVSSRIIGTFYLLRFCGDDVRLKLRIRKNIQAKSEL